MASLGAVQVDGRDIGAVQSVAAAAVSISPDLASLINMVLPWYTMGPIAVGAMSQAEQQHLLHMYSGVLVDGTTGVPALDYFYYRFLLAGVS